MPAADQRETVGTRVLASGCALALCAAFFWAQQQDALHWNGASNRTDATLFILTVIATVTVAVRWCDASRRPLAALIGSVIVGAVLTRWLVVVAVLFAWLVVRVSRSARPTWQKLLLLLGVWTATCIARWSAPRLVGLPYGTFGMYWSCLPAGVVCLVVERARGRLDGVTRLEEWTYLLALPRFFLPFLQPIGAASFIRSRQKEQTPRALLGALGLGIYGVACWLSVRYTHYAIKPAGEALGFVHAPRILLNGVRIYGVNAAPIFCAVALLRLLGYQAGSGFRLPFLASSIADFYRRWNYYFYEYASTVFYLSLVGKFRRWMPLSVAYALSGYASVLLGVWLLDNVTFQLAIGRDAQPLLNEVTDVRQLLSYLAVWSLIIGPQVALAPLRRLRRNLWWRVGAHALTLSLCVAVMTLLFCYQLTLY